MGLFSKLKHSFNEGRKEAHTEAEARRGENLSEVAKMVEPNYGDIVTFKVDADENVRQMYIDLLVAMANSLDAKAVVTGKNVILQFSNADTAKVLRETWK